MSYQDKLYTCKRWVGAFQFEDTEDSLKFEILSIPHSYGVDIKLSGVFDGRELDRIITLLQQIQKELKVK